MCSPERGRAHWGDRDDTFQYSDEVLVMRTEGMIRRIWDEISRHRGTIITECRQMIVHNPEHSSNEGKLLQPSVACAHNR